MIQTTSLDLEDLRQTKIRFWLNWTISNALGMSIGWCLGEYIGQLALKSYSVRISTLMAAFIFELILWLARLLPSQYFSKQRPIKYLDGLIWFVTELFGWIVFSFMEPSSQWLTSEVVFITGMGVTFWIIFAIFRLLQKEKKQNPPEWFPKAFIYTLIGFIFGNMVISFLMAIATSIGFSLGRLINLYVGWGVAGFFLGGAFGAITGLILVMSIDWTSQYQFED
jgi:hypothetical protein